ncbi:MAG: BatD family protein [Dysgonomonas sp.]
MQKLLFLISYILLSIGLATAQNTSFEASAPPAVVKGEQFRLTYTLRNGDGKNLQPPKEIKGFDILYGPALAQSQNTHIINGKVSSESAEAYTFTLMANEEGNFRIPAATIQSDGKTYTSNTLNIKVLPPDKSSQSQQGSTQSGATSPTGTVSANEAFIRPIISKTKVFEQEALMITFRFYSVYDIRDIGKIEFPEFEGFIVEDMDIPSNIQLTMENYKGRNYFVGDLKKSILFPQRSGKITIPSGKIEMLFSVPTGRKIRSFFGTQEMRSDVRKVLVSSPVNIDVSPLPTGKPDSYSNAVGTFSMSSKISDTKITANDAITITLNITGTGNLKLIKNPTFEFPKDFEVYDPKVNNNTRITESGLTGSRTIEYLFIPRHQGQYTIPPASFSYFDPKSNSYKTLKTPEYKLEVAKDPNAKNNTGVSYTNQNEVQAIQDIRFLKTGDIHFVKENKFLWGSIGYILWYLVPILLFVAALMIYNNNRKQNANITLLKTKRANKVAIKRLKTAESYLNLHNKEKFYEEVLRAIWGYLSDKLTIPVADLNRENIEHELNKYGVSEELTSTFISILDTCEFARYAPAESDEAMDKIYNQTVNAISGMENTAKKKK